MRYQPQPQNWDRFRGHGYVRPFRDPHALRLDFSRLLSSIFARRLVGRVSELRRDSRPALGVAYQGR